MYGTGNVKDSRLVQLEKILWDQASLRLISNNDKIYVSSKWSDRWSTKLMLTKIEAFLHRLLQDCFYLTYRLYGLSSTFQQD